MPNRVEVLCDGYASMDSNCCASKEGLGCVRANCSCVLITGNACVIVDTMTPWDGKFILDSLETRGIKPDDVDFVVSTHGHSDHHGNNNLFLKAKHIVGFCVSFQDQYFLHPFDQGTSYKIADGIEVLPTPGHTADDVSVLVKTEHLGTVVVAGDIFEREEDIEKPEIWRSEGGSVDPDKQERSRARIIELADYIVPGHGPMFKVTDEIKKKFRLQ